MAYLLDNTAALHCPHVGGTAQLVNVSQRVFLAGNPAVLVPGNPLPVTGCPLQSQPPGTTFCSAGSFSAGTQRVFAGGQPLATSDSQALFVNTGAAAAARSHQTRVEAK